ncbi:fibronectin type III domain-containing protein [Paenibacillus barengoltzii]|uniref:fibronectin type III domain-containing protein n=1 Tax=Paenibacillus barengoltzii TaxID=343517 RepID=UPI003F8B450D
MNRIISLVLSVSLVSGIVVAGLGTKPQETVAKPLDPSLTACTSIFLPSIKEELSRMGLESTTTIGSRESYTTYPLDWNKLDQEKLVVYGGPDDIQKNPDYDQEYDSSTKQYRYLGYGSGKNAYFNKDFPPDATATTDVSTRDWIKEPWEKTLNSSYPNKQAEWYWQTSSEQRAEWLKGIYDKYTNNTVNKAGNWTKFPTPWNEYIDQFFVWQQQPGPLFPGTVTGWHTRASGDWYDTFYVSPTETLVGDMAINPFDAQVNEANRTVGINIWSNFQYRQTTDLKYKFSEDADGTKLLEADKTHSAEAFDGYASTGAKKYPAITSIKADLLTPVTASSICKDAERIANVVNTTPKAILDHAYTQEAKTLMVGIFGDYAETTKSIPIPENAWEKLALGEQVYLTVSINSQNSPNELLWENNEAIWLLTAGTFKTPPIRFRDITTTSGVAYWDPLPEDTVDHYELTCSSDNKKTNTAKNAEWALTGLTPNTTYTCDLEAFNPDGVSGGVETGTFTTLPDNTPSTPGPGTSPGGSGGGWKELGLVREINNERQESTSTSFPKTVNDYKAIKANKSLANTYSPYFGENLGVYAIPDIGTSTYSWNFNYQDEEWDSCKTTDKDGKCQGGSVTVTKTATDSYTVKYPKIGPTGLSSTTSDPKGKSANVSSKWGKSGKITVTKTESGECVGADPRDPNPRQFTYYVPTELLLVPSLLVDKGFNPTYQTIDKEWQDQWIKVEGTSYSLGYDGRSLSGTASLATLSFKMLWSRYGNIGTGG